MSLHTSIRILNFDESITRQKTLVERFHPEIVALTDLGPRCRMWMNEKTAGEIKERLDPQLKNAITFLGSGDFHHVSSLLIDQFQDPISVIVFDHHPEWDTRPPHLGCGSWITQILQKENVKKVILWGVSSRDISMPSILFGALQSLKNDRVEIYPYQHRPTSLLFRKVPENRSIQLTRKGPFKQIHWQELKDKDMPAFFSEVVDRLPTRQVYVSLDKDCLRKNYALTNWEEGFLDLDSLLALFQILKGRTDWVGLDITGDYSPLHVQGIFKKFLASFDHPHRPSAYAKTLQEITAVNEATNLRILECISEHQEKDGPGSPGQSLKQ